jgi:putative transposase
MSNRLTSLAPNEFFHIYNRGTDKRTIFFDYADHHRFFELLYLCNSEKQINVRDVRTLHDSVFEFDRGEALVSIGAFCLMPNHFHLLVTTHKDGGISKFMKKLSTGYSMYFNKRYNRTGALFQGRFKSQHADIDEYLKYLYAYIHLNPVKLIDKDWKEQGSKDAAKSFDFAASFQYSSLSDYLHPAHRPEAVILNPSSFPEYFMNHEDTKAELFDWLTHQEASLLPAL